MYRGGLDRFRKAQTLEPFSVSKNASSKAPSLSPPAPNSHPRAPPSESHPQTKNQASSEPSLQHATQIGGGQSTWQPPDWAIDPRPGIYYLDVLKDGQVLDRINLDKRRHIFGRQQPTCDFILDHLSVSRQHAAIVPHRNGSIFVIDLGSVHGTFVANERLKKDIPMELEVGQSVRFAASTRTYILRKNSAALFPKPPPPAEIDLTSPPDPSDEDAVLAYNTTLNRYGLTKSDLFPESGSSPRDSSESGRLAKRRRRLRVAFRDQVGGELVQVVGISDGADVETEPGPIGVKEGSLVGKYESLVHITVIPKGKEHMSLKEEGFSPRGVTDKLQQALNKVKSSTGRTVDGLYGDIFAGGLGSSWAYSSSAALHSPNAADESAVGSGQIKDHDKGCDKYDGKHDPTFGDDDDDDLFGH
ncbi:SMAD/FHA domain-containing protein [Wolffia australiana]